MASLGLDHQPEPTHRKFPWIAHLRRPMPPPVGKRLQHHVAGLVRPQLNLAPVKLAIGAPRPEEARGVVFPPSDDEHYLRDFGAVAYPDTNGP